MKIHKEFLYTEHIGDSQTLFFYKENILPPELYLKVDNWLKNKTFKDGFCLDGKEIPRKQLWFHEEKEYFCSAWKYKYDRWESETYDEILKETQKYIQIELEKILEEKNLKFTIPKINSCLVNKYRDGNDSIKPHSDSSYSFGEYPTIVNISLGGTREFIIKKKKKKDRIILELKDNSILIMAGGSQKYFTHEIPKNESIHTRYSMTFREHLSNYI